MATEATNLRERHAERTREGIIRASIELFEEVGFAAATVDDIARRADIAPRTFFRYFPTKESVVFAETTERRKWVCDQLAARPTGEAPLTSLLEAFRSLADLPRDRSKVRLTRTIIEQNPVLLGHLKLVLLHQFQEDLIAALAAREGKHLNPLETRVAVASAIGCFGAAMESFLGEGKRTLRAYFDAAVEACASAWEAAGA